MHHIIDPATGAPASSPWRTVSVAAATCADANIASTASIVKGAQAIGWLATAGLPARLVAHDGTVTVTAGWPIDAQLRQAVDLVDGPPACSRSTLRTRPSGKPNSERMLA